MKNKLTKKIKNIAKIATLAALIATSSIAKGQGNVEAASMPSENGSSRARINLFYELPGDVKGYTFTDLYETGYLSKSNLTKSLGNTNLSARSEVKLSNYFDNHAGIGLEYKFARENSSFVGSFKALPLWVDKSGLVEKTGTVGFFLRKKWNLPKKYELEASTFGEMNMLSEKKGKTSPSWGYGEACVYVGKKDGKIDIGAGVDFYNKGKTLEPAVTLGPRIRMQL